MIDLVDPPRRFGRKDKIPNKKELLSSSFLFGESNGLFHPGADKAVQLSQGVSASVEFPGDQADPAVAAEEESVYVFIVFTVTFCFFMDITDEHGSGQDKENCSPWFKSLDEPAKIKGGDPDETENDDADDCFAAAHFNPVVCDVSL